MIEQLQQQCQDIHQENQEVLKHLTKMRQSALEQSQEILKLQNFLKVVDQESTPMRDQIKIIKQSCCELEDQTKREDINRQIDQLQDIMMRYIADQQKNGKKPKRQIKKDSPKKFPTDENDQNTLNLRKRPYKVVIESSDESSESPQKPSKKRVKPNTEVLDKANCLINEIFNFNS